MLRQHLFFNENEYQTVKARIDSVFQFDRRFPQQVFANGFVRFAFVEFDQMLTANFWNVLSSCAKKFGDDEIYFLLSDPHPNGYYFANFNRFGGLKLNSSATSSEYVDAVRAEPIGSSADSFLYATSVAFWCGSTASWGFYGDREMGIGIVASRDRDFLSSEIQGMKWFSIDEALTDIIALNFSGQVVPEEIAAEAKRCYG